MRIGIVGLGLIGGSLGLDLRGLGHTVLGMSRKQETCRIAEKIGAVDQARPEPDILATCDLVFLCTPIGLLIPVAEAIQLHLNPAAILTDVGSVKASLVAPLSHIWPRFIGGHPMAGTAESGILAAQNNLFVNRPYVLTPTPETDPEIMPVVTEVVKSLQSILYVTSPAEHDQAVAWISHLPVMVSAALLGSPTNHESQPEILELAQALASSGFRDTSRVGGGNPELGRMMAEYNSIALLTSLKHYQQELTGLIELLETQNWSGLEAYLAQQAQARPAFVGEA